MESCTGYPGISLDHAGCGKTGNSLIIVDLSAFFFLIFFHAENAPRYFSFELNWTERKDIWWIGRDLPKHILITMEKKQMSACGTRLMWIAG